MFSGDAAELNLLTLMSKRQYTESFDALVLDYLHLVAEIGKTEDQKLTIQTMNQTAFSKTMGNLQLDMRSNNRASNRNVEKFAMKLEQGVWAYLQTGSKNKIGEALQSVSEKDFKAGFKFFLCNFNMSFLRSHFFKGR